MLSAYIYRVRSQHFFFVQLAVKNCVTCVTCVTRPIFSRHDAIYTVTQLVTQFFLVTQSCYQNSETRQMTNLKSEWLALLDDNSAEPDSVFSNEETARSNDETSDKPPERLNQRWLALLNESSDETSDTSSNTISQVTQFETQIDSEPEIKKESANDKPTKKLPIFEATTKQLDYWHAFGCNVFLQSLLRRYDLDFYSYNLPAYDGFKIGFDDKRHVATFAIDETHYHMIQFNKFNSAPVNSDDAESVLEEIQRLRILRYGQPEKFSGRDRGNLPARQKPTA